MVVMRYAKQYELWQVYFNDISSRFFSILIQIPSFERVFLMINRSVLMFSSDGLDTSASSTTSKLLPMAIQTMLKVMKTYFLNCRYQN